MDEENGKHTTESAIEVNTNNPDLYSVLLMSAVLYIFLNVEFKNHTKNSISHTAL